MRLGIKKFSLYVNLSIIASIISSVSIMACAFLGKSDNIDQVIKIIFPLVFWVGLLAEQFFIWKVNSFRKKLEAEGKLRRIRGKPGVLSILQTEEGAIADLIFVLSTIVFAILLLFKIGKGFPQYLFIFFMVLSFRMHCILNGKNFRYKKYLAKRKVD